MYEKQLICQALSQSIEKSSVVFSQSPTVQWKRGKCVHKVHGHHEGQRQKPRSETERFNLGHRRVLTVESSDEVARLRVHSPDPAERLELEIRFEAAGPVVRTRATALEMESAGAVTARCESFQVRAENDIDLRAGGELRCRAEDAASIEARSFTADASPGAVRLRANDDVQLLGELVLLNCDRQPDLPDWVPDQPAEAPSLPPSEASGDAELIASLSGGAPREAE